LEKASFCWFWRAISRRGNKCFWYTLRLSSLSDFYREGRSQRLLWPSKFSLEISPSSFNGYNPRIFYTPKQTNIASIIFRKHLSSNSDRYWTIWLISPTVSLKASSFNFEMNWEMTPAAKRWLEKRGDSIPCKRQIILVKSLLPESYKSMPSSEIYYYFFLQRDGRTQLFMTKVSKLPANFPIFCPPSNISRITDITGDRRRLDAV